jgi:hypothetical protein
VGPIQLGFDFYNCYSACSDPRPQSAVYSQASAAAPGHVGTGTVSCWIVTFDLMGTSLEFKLDGDCDQFFDNSTALDNFGWQVHMTNGLASNLLGPLLTGDPSGFFTAVHGCGPIPRGDGTKFQTGTCASGYPFGNYGSGLGAADQNYSWHPTATTAAPNGCYWFGGYATNNPYASFWMVVYGDKDASGTRFCSPANANSAFASGGVITMTGSGSVSNADTVATATSVPNQVGIFVSGRGTINVALGCGNICVGSPAVRRSNVVFASGNTASWAYDESNLKRSIGGGTLPNRRNFQYWFRDPMNSAACGNTHNLSDAFGITVTP